MNRTRILEKVFKIFPKEKIKFIIQYGNFNGNDIDLFIVLNEKSGYSSIKSGILDIGCVGKNWLNTMIENLDPFITEPLLNGIKIYGEPIEELKQKLEKVRPNKRTLLYLIKCAETYYDWAKKHYLKKDFVESLVALSYTLSCSLFVQYYFKNNAVKSLADLLTVYPNTLFADIRDLIKSKKEIKIDNLEKIFRRTKRVLTTAKNLLV